MISHQLAITFSLLTNPRDRLASFFWSIEDISQFNVFIQGFIYSIKTVNQKGFV